MLAYRRYNFHVFLHLAVIFLLLIPIGVTAFQGTFSRFHADDFCAVGLVNRLGFWDAARYWYFNWTGRFAFIFFTQLLGMGGPRLASALPAISLFAWLVGFWLFFNWAIRFFSTGFQTAATPTIHSRTYLLPGLALSVMSIFLILQLVPNIFQSVLWQSGLINNTLPLILMTYNLSLVLHATWQQRSEPGNKIYVLASVILAISFVTSGFHEGFVVYQLSVFGLILIMGLVAGRGVLGRSFLLVSAAGLAGTLIGLVLVVSAPGNALRQQTISTVTHPGILELLRISVYHAYITGHAQIKHAWLPISSIFFTCMGVGIFHFARLNKTQPDAAGLARFIHNLLPILLGSIPACFALVTATMMPSEYFFRSYPDPRAMIIPLSAIVIAVVITGYLLGIAIQLIGWRLTRNRARILSLIILAVVLAASFSMITKAIEAIPESQVYAYLWDQRDTQLNKAREQGVTQIAAPGLATLYGVQDLSFEPDNWINRCLAWYYGFEVVEGR